MAFSYRKFSDETLKNTKLSKSKYKVIKDEIKDRLVKIAKYKFPYDSQVIERINKLNPSYKNGWRILTIYEEYKLYRIIKEISKLFPQIIIEGEEGIWITKPSFNSRGRGIKCINKIKSIFKGELIQKSKVVQKYIERPFLLLLEGKEGNVIKLQKRKFDIRQWVLVTSFNPLNVYMFDSAYMKLCGSEYDLDCFQDKFKHISNYSVQKENSNVADIQNDLAMSVNQFEEHLKTFFGVKVSWKKLIIPKLRKIILNLLESVSDLITNNQVN